MSNHLAKEAQCRYNIPFGGQQKVDDLAFSVDGLVQIFPVTFDSDVGFIHSPSATHGAFTPPKGFI